MLDHSVILYEQILSQLGLEMVGWDQKTRCILRYGEILKVFIWFHFNNETQRIDKKACDLVDFTISLHKFLIEY